MRFFLLVVMIILVTGCKKDNGDDTTVYKWRRDLYRASVKKDGPAILASSDPPVNLSIYISTDFVFLTEAKKNKQQDSIFKVSSRMLAYKYEKL